MKLSTFVSTAFLASLANCLSLDVDSEDSICAAAKLVADGEWNYYEGTRYGGTVGMFTYPYYWWHAGEAFGGLLNYYTFCDPTNSTLEKLLYNAMIHQAGSNWDYIPSNQSMTEGNDDQGVWGLTVMEAVERNFTNDADHPWLELAQAVYNTMYNRWDVDSCGGGLRWQIFTWNSGYDYKNSISNACLFSMAARLARYTGNTTYAEVAEKVWTWMVEDAQFITEVEGEYIIYDGAKIANNCSQVTKTRWSYTYGVLMSGCAYLYDFSLNGNGTASDADDWEGRIGEIWKALGYFFVNDIMSETSCYSSKSCNTDQVSFRSLFLRGLMATMQLVNSTQSEIMKDIRTSAAGAAKSCSGGSDGVTCGVDWTTGSWDGKYGLGQQMSALECILALLANDVPKPYTAFNGGSSTSSNANAGLGTDSTTNQNIIDVTTKDKAGAGVLTAVVLAVIVGGSIWMVL